MKCLLICLCISIVLSNPPNKKRSFQFKFPGGDRPSHAKLVGTIDHELTEFTLCHWSKTNRPVSVEAFEIIFNYYFLGGSDHYILTAIIPNRLWHIYGDDKGVAVNTSLPSTEWIHLCFIWTVTDSTYEIYINGQLTSRQTDSRPSLPIKPMGIVQLGLRGDAIQRLTGQISELNMWDYALTPGDVTQIYNCEDQLEGNVISWYESTWELLEGTTVSPVRLPCGGRH